MNAEIEDIDVDELMISANDELAAELKQYMTDESLGGFYESLGETISSNKRGVYGSGLAADIFDKRPYLLDGFFEELM